MRLFRLPGFVLLLGFFFFSHTAGAHRPSDAYLNLSVSQNSLQGQWEIALRDLDHAIGLDRDLDGEITWGEVRSQHDAIAAYALARLQIKASSDLCNTEIQEHLFAKRSDEGYAVLRFDAHCKRPVDRLSVAYDLLFDLDPLHRGLVQIESDGISHSAIFSPEQRNWSLDLTANDVWHQFQTYLKEGVWHIWIGFDHILFLLLLLLPAAQRAIKASWQPRDRLREVFMEVVKVVTAFSLAHSLTLGLSAAGWIDLPSRVVEPAIAATIIFTAFNNIYPVFTQRLWALAFGFGLIHGVGFAAVLQDLDLPVGAFLLSLLSFNLGVELGQLVIVAIVLPVIFAFRAAPKYPRYVIRFGSLLIALVATVWLVERVFDVTLLT